MPTEVKNSQWGSERLWNRIALVAGVFALLICVLLVANYIQVKKSDPVNMTVINSLVERLYANPADSVLRKDIRTLDLLSRKAYFTSQWQIRTGGYLLLALIAIMVISLQVVEYRRKINPVISSAPDDESMLQRRKARKWIVIGGSSILLIAVVFAILASNDMAVQFNKLSKGEVAVTEDQPVINQTDSVTETPGIISDSAVIQDTATAPAVIASTDNFPNFRGNAGLASKSNIPVSWDGISGQNVVWKTALPLPGQNSPVIWGDRIFVTGANASKQEVYCFDRNTGKILWTVKIGTTTKKPRVSEETGLAAPTVRYRWYRCICYFSYRGCCSHRHERQKDLGKRSWTSQ